MLLTDKQKEIVTAARKYFGKPVVSFAELRAWANKALKLEYAPQFIVKNPDMRARDLQGHIVRGMCMLVSPVEPVRVGRPRSVAKQLKLGLDHVLPSKETLREATQVAKKNMQMANSSRQGIASRGRTGTHN